MEKLRSNQITEVRIRSVRILGINNLVKFWELATLMKSTFFTNDNIKNMYKKNKWPQNSNERKKYTIILNFFCNKWLQLFFSVKSFKIKQLTHSIRKSSHFTNSDFFHLIFARGRQLTLFLHQVFRISLKLFAFPKLSILFAFHLIKKNLIWLNYFVLHKFSPEY